MTIAEATRGGAERRRRHHRRAGGPGRPAVAAAVRQRGRADDLRLVQRVSRAQVRVHGEIVGRIDARTADLRGGRARRQEADADATARKVAALRIFPGKHPMDLSVKDSGGGCLVVSQFTLAGSIRKGNRPSFDGAEAPARAQALYERVADQLRAEGLTVATGRFAARDGGRAGERRTGDLHDGRPRRDPAEDRALSRCQRLLRAASARSPPRRAGRYLQRVLRDLPAPHLEVQVGGGGPAGLSDAGDHLAGPTRSPSAPAATSCGHTRSADRRRAAAPPSCRSRSACRWRTARCRSRAANTGVPLGAARSMPSWARPQRLP